MIRHLYVYTCAGLVCLFASVAHAGAIEDLMSELGMTQAPGGAETTVALDLGALSLDTSLISTSTIAVATSTAPDPEAEKKQQIAALQALVKTLTAKLKALIEEKKNAVASLSDSTEICSVKRDLRRGMKGDDVKALQKFLVTEGELAAQSSYGNFGALTEEAVQQWQMHNGIVSYGSADTTGYGLVGKETRALMQQACTTSAKGTYMDPSFKKNSNSLSLDVKPQNVRLSLAIDNVSITRGAKIPVRVTIQDPVPYLGANIEFMQTNSKGGVNTFGSPIYLPVGFTGQVVHFINSSHMSIEEKDKSFGISEIPLVAIIEARFRDSNAEGVAGQDVTRSFGRSDAVRVYVSEDTSNERLVFSVNGVSGDVSGDIKADFAKFFSATTTSRANAIEYCDLLSDVVTKSSVYSCKWKDEELAGIIQAKKKTIPAGATGRTLGSYFLFMNGVISKTMLSVSREDALQDCGRTHTDNVTTPMTCVWENEIIYDKGGLEDPPPDTYIEPGAAPILI